MQNHILENGEEIVLITTHRRKAMDPRLKNDQTIVGTVYNGFVFLSYAFCHRKDSFCRKEGRSIALDRLINCLENETYGTETLVGVIPLADVVHYHIYDSLASLGIESHAHVYQIAEKAQEVIESGSLKTRMIVASAVEMIEQCVGSAQILQAHRNAVA